MNRGEEEIQDTIRDLAIRITDRLVYEGFVEDCTDTDALAEFDVQDIIVEEISKWCRNVDFDLGAF